MKKRYIDDLRSDDRLKLKTLYHLHRNEMLMFGKKYQLSEDDLLDIYQDAFLALRKRALSGQLDTVKCSLKTYLFGIGKHMIYDVLKKRNKRVQFEDHIISEERSQEESEKFMESELTEQQLLLKSCFGQLSARSQKILTLFYYRGLSLNEIAEMEGYGSVNAVKATKSRCLRILKQKIKEAAAHRTKLSYNL